MNRKRNNIIVLISLSVICGILITASSLNSSILDPVRKGVGYIITPIEAGVNRLGIAFYDMITDNKTLEAVKAENEELKKTVDQLVLDNTRLQEESLELERLRALYQMDQDYGKFETVGARVIAKDSVGWFNVFRINKGSDDGIEVDMNVIAGGGLVGIVTDVGSNYATVRSIIDDSSRVSAMAMQSGYDAMVEGSLTTYETGRLLLTGILADADVKDGDMIVTSNVSSKFLPGILIGYATDIKSDPNTLTKSGYVVPIATFDTLQEVLIITKLK